MKNVKATVFHGRIAIRVEEIKRPHVGFGQAIAEKTGYREDMLELDPELEAGLGIDSIKRVEILSALQQQRGVPVLTTAESP